jgi:hypothetical protein
MIERNHGEEPEVDITIEEEQEITLEIKAKHETGNVGTGSKLKTLSLVAYNHLYTEPVSF